MKFWNQRVSYPSQEGQVVAECLQQLEVLGLVSSDLPLLHFMQRLLGAVIQAQSLVVKNDPLSVLDQKSL